MVSVQTSSIEKKEKLSVYNLNYPIIKSDNEKNIIGHINKKIYEDIISFKCAIEDISNTKKAKNQLVVELFKNQNFYNFMSKIDYFEWTSSSELKQVDFSNYIKLFLSNSNEWLKYLKENY